MNTSSSSTSRRSIIKSFFGVIAASAAGVFGLSHLTSRETTAMQTPPAGGAPRSDVPLFSGSKTHGGLVYVAGKGEHTEGNITDHTIAVLNKIEEELVRAGSSMDRVLKVNVYLADLADYDEMNAAYRGRFGDDPPVRTTVACYGGIPGGSLVEIDAIAAV